MCLFVLPSFCQFYKGNNCVLKRSFHSTDVCHIQISDLNFFVLAKKKGQTQDLKVEYRMRKIWRWALVALCPDKEEESFAPSKGLKLSPKKESRKEAAFRLRTFWNGCEIIMNSNKTSFRTYCESTSLHGWQYIYHSSQKGAFINHVVPKIRNKVVNKKPKIGRKVAEI